MYKKALKVQILNEVALIRVVRKRQSLPVNQNLSLVYFPPAKFQLVSCNLSLAMIWQMTYTHKLPKLCSATLKDNEKDDFVLKTTLFSHLQETMQRQ